MLRASVALLALMAAVTPRPAGAQSAATALPLSGRSDGAGDVRTTQTVPPGLISSVNALNPSILVQGPYRGSTPAVGDRPFAGVLSLSDAVERGLAYSLSAIGLVHAARQARAQATLARSALMPQVAGWLSDQEQKINLAALGFRFDLPIPGFTLPETVGPFNVLDLRARVSQNVFDRTALNNYRAAQEAVRGSDLVARDSRDLIVLAVGGAYLQTMAARARLQSAAAQIETARTLFQRASQQRTAGLATPIDVNRAQVQVLVQQQRLTTLQADLAKQKINLARMIGLPATDQYELDTNVPFTSAPVINIDQAVKEAPQQRADVKAAEAHVRAAELALGAAEAGRLPSVAVSADYGASKANPIPAQSTYSVTAAVRIPIWEGGRAQGEIERAQAVLAQRRAELDDIRAEVEGDVRKAYLDLQAATSQVEVGRLNVDVTTENLTLTRQRFDAGIGDNLSVVQSQELVAVAELDYINSVFAHNLAKLALARAMGRAADGLSEFMKLP